jgi:hypothetical protein
MNTALVGFDLRELACQILKQHLLEYADKDVDAAFIASDDPEAEMLCEDDWEVLLDNISRAKVNVTVTL